MRQMYLEHFGSEPVICTGAPGRLEILGNHTDYNEGFVLSAAILQTTDVALGHAEGTKCTFREDGMDFSFDLSELDTPVPGDWMNYVKGLLVGLRSRGVKITAFNACVRSTVPTSAGMSSSAALEMAFLSAFEVLYNVKIPAADMARIGQAVENEYLGLKTGLLDQYSSLYGRENSLILSDFRTVEVLKTISMPPGWVFVVANTMVKHNLVASEYNNRRASCENARDAVKKSHPEIKALRDVDSAMLDACKNDMDPIDYKRAKHVVGEDERVHKGTEVLENGDIEAFGKLLYESHDSSKKYFENSCDELDCLVELSKSIPGCIGARLSGGGFGGISIHLVKAEQAEKYCSRLKTAYKSQTGKEIQTFICPLGDGALVRLAKQQKA